MESALVVPGKKAQRDMTADTSVAEPKLALPMNHPQAPHVTIVLQKGEGDEEKEGQFVSINGQDDFVVPRGVEVSVPVPVYEVLKNAMRKQISEDGSESYEISRFAIVVKSALPH